MGARTDFHNDSSYTSRTSRQLVNEESDFEGQHVEVINAKVGAVYNRVAESFAITIGSALVSHAMGFSAVVLTLLGSSILSAVALKTL